MSAWIATGALCAAAFACAAHATYHPNSPIWGRSIGRGPARGRNVYLTFDDGPNRTATERILQVLDHQRVPAAFFLVGDHVRRHPDLARSVADLGHEVGNHTQRHRKLHLMGPRAVEEEIQVAHETILQAIGRRPRVFRAPHGLRNPFVHRTARRLGYEVFGWTVGVWDSARPGAEVIRSRVRKGLAPGAIILLHDGDGRDPVGNRSQTAEALPGIIKDALDAGYSFRPLGDLISSRIQADS